MQGPSKMLRRPTWLDSAKPTSSPALEFGLSLYGSPVGPMMFPSGLDPRPVNHSVEPARSAGSMMPDICGQHGLLLSRSANLQLSLENKLRALTDTLGSIMFVMISNQRDTPSGRPIFARRVAVRLTSAREFTLSGWPTTTKEDAHSSARHGYMIKGNAGTTLLDAARLAGWATPVSTEIGNTIENYLAMKAAAGPRTAITHPSLQAQLVVSGTAPIGSNAEMGNGGLLSPEHSRWLMGIPRAWEDCAPTVTQSLPRKRRSSSKR
jgi:hypothetical protein